MDWLEELAAERRAKDPNFAESERRIEAEGGGYVVERMGRDEEIGDDLSGDQEKDGQPSPDTSLGTESERLS
jgi:hypothetical protein